MLNPALKGFLPTNDRVASIATRAVALTAAVARELWELVNMLANPSAELGRLADECESTQPELAARLRKALQQGW